MSAFLQNELILAPNEADTNIREQIQKISYLTLNPKLTHTGEAERT
jgi:tRNA A22 N-methylase